MDVLHLFVVESYISHAIQHVLFVGSRTLLVFSHPSFVEVSANILVLHSFSQLIESSDNFELQFKIFVVSCFAFFRHVSNASSIVVVQSLIQSANEKFVLINTINNITDIIFFIFFVEGLKSPNYTNSP